MELLRLLGVPSSAAFWFIHLVALLSVAWLFPLRSLPLFVAWSIPFRVVSPLLVLLGFLVVGSFSASGLFFPSLSPLLELPLALDGLSLLTRSNLRFPPRRGPPFGPSHLMFGLFALLLVRLSFAHPTVALSLCLHPTASLPLLFQSAVSR